MKKTTTMVCAIALGVTWAAAPAMAQESTKKQAEQKADQIEKQAERKADQIERDAKQKARETRQQGDAEADRVRGKSGDTVGEKIERAKDKLTGNGAVNDGVRAAQRALQEKGFNPGPIDGVMGPRTSAAVRDFQQKENLAVTGQLDAQTRSRLMASAGSPAASPASEPTRRQMR